MIAFTTLVAPKGAIFVDNHKLTFLGAKLYKTFI